MKYWAALYIGIMLQDLRFMLRYLTFSLLKNWKKLCFENQLWRHYFQSMKQESSVHTDFFCLNANSWMKWCEFLFSSLCSSYIFVTVKFAVKNGTYCIVWSCTNWYFSTAHNIAKNCQIFIFKFLSIFNFSLRKVSSDKTVEQVFLCLNEITRILIFLILYIV